MICEEEVSVVVGVERLLLVDDDQYAFEIQQTIQQFGRQMGYSVDLASSLAEAEGFLRDPERQYFMVVVDVWFPDEEIAGDAFILDHRHLLNGATIVVLSARDPWRIRRDRPELVEMKIPVLQKGPMETYREIERLSREALERRRKTVASVSVDPQTEPRTPEDWMGQTEAGRALVRKAQDILIKWLKSTKELDATGIFYAGKAYSANTLIEAIQKGTKVGRDHIDMVLDLFEHDLEV
jgi:DNA-binding NtrC family response regulator